MISIVTLLIVLTLSILLTRIATVALTHTGLSRESAKFQARSAFTGVGFTTSESEKVVNHPIRRRILLMLMLLGNAGIGFIGGGAILKDQDYLAGTVSAASIWNTGAIGMAVAFDRMEIAVALSYSTFSPSRCSAS